MIHKELFSCSGDQGPGFLSGWRGIGGSAPPTPAPAPQSPNPYERPPSLSWRLYPNPLSPLHPGLCMMTKKGIDKAIYLSFLFVPLTLRHFTQRSSLVGEPGRVPE